MASLALSRCAAKAGAESLALGAPQPARGMAKVALAMQPHSKRRIKALQPIKLLKRKWLTWNDKNLVPKFLRHAERVARELGVVQEVQAFDEAAKAFPNAPPIIASTLLERGNVIMRDVEQWEGTFWQLKHARREALAKPYPDALIDQWTAGEKVVETERADDTAKGDKKGQQKGGKPSDAAAETSAEAAADGTPKSAKTSFAAADSAASQSVGLADFYEKSGPMTASSDESKGLAIAPRESSADTIGDMRSLERAYSHRLALLVRDKASGRWFLPGGERLEGEPMKQAAERSLRAVFGDSGLQAWYVGNSPVGHWLRVYSPEEQSARQCYGEKVFIYRAEILKGRFRMPREDETGARSPQAFPYSDFMWLTRDEMEGVMSSNGSAEAPVADPEGRATWKYLHQVVGLGAGEEFARAQAWKKKIEAKQLTVDQATGRRSHRVTSQRTSGLRLPAIATRQAALLAARPFDKDGAKHAAVKAYSESYYARLRASYAQTRQQRKALNMPAQTALIAARTAARGSKPLQVGAATAAAKQQLT